MNISEINLPYYKPSIAGLSNAQRFTLYRGNITGQSSQKDTPDSSQLRVGNTLYDTSLPGINATITHDDFAGVLEARYEQEGEISHLVFVVWFCAETRRYLLTALGQYTASSYQADLEQFSNTQGRSRRMIIRLHAIPEHKLDELPRKLLDCHLSNATIFLPDTVLLKPVPETSETAAVAIVAR